MLSSFYTAISGLQNNALTINVISNNLANLNTTSFKLSRTSFAEVLGGVTSTSTNGNPIQQGNGSVCTSITQIHNQGSLYSTGRSTDVGISGNGFLVVAAGGGTAYTRAGSFSFNAAGEMMSTDGFKVAGYPAVDGVIDRNAALVPITVNKGTTMPPKVTENIVIMANLDSRTAVDGIFTTGIQIVDSLGESHTATMTYTKTSETDWSWDVTIPAVDAGGSEADPPVSIGTGTISFNASGILSSPTENQELTVSGLTNGAEDMTINLEFFDAAGVPRITGYAAESNVFTTIQDGYQASVLLDINIGSNGVVNGVFSNGLTKPLAQLAMALFPNIDGLMKLKGSTYQISGSSGDPSIGTPGSGGRGFLSSGSLEQSNVDIAEEFTNLIIAQRGYQANSRVVGITDELYQEALNMKR